MKLSELRGTGVALVTPFLNDGSVDYPALEKVIRHVIDGGVEYVLSLGTTGETPTLSQEEKTELIRFTTAIANNDVPVLVGIGGNNTKEVVQQLKSYPLKDVLAVLSVSPYYSKPSEEGLYQHYKAVSEASPKPIVLYNVPGRTGRTIPASVVLRLARDFENIVGLKEASGDLVHSMHILRDKPKDFTVVSGEDMLTLTEIACGMEGVISVAANYMAKDMSDLVRYALNNQYEEARKIHYKLMPAFEYMFAENNPAGVKSFLAAAGLIEENLRLPVVPVSQPLKEQIRKYIEANY